MTLEEIRTIIITAIASDDRLSERFVFKGGNALELVHKIGQRASLDMDFSVSGDFEDIDEIRTRLLRSLQDRFDTVALVMFDFAFGPRPSTRQVGDLWGGYNAEFKLIDRGLHDELGRNIDAMRRQAITSGPQQQRKFRIEISPFEYCDDRIVVHIDHYACKVYSIDMIAVEKLRAICQQSPDYAERLNPAPRARDFYDIVASVTQGGVDFAAPKTSDLARRIFAAKRVPLSLIYQIHQQREFHRTDWASVEVAVKVRLRQFDYYFEVVLAEVEKLKPLGIV